MAGKVFLVGAGPGDPGLITVKGRRCLENADVVVYDRLLDPSLLQAAPAAAERVFVGKERARRAMEQDEINRLLVDRAAAGLQVVRLKGGDPFVFGRGGEEAMALAQRGIPFEVVPGVTSAVAAPAYAGIPITHRGLSSCFTVVTASEDPSKPEPSISWAALARTGGTLVVLMGWANLEPVLRALRREGMDPITPAALVQWGTWPQQRTVTGCLANIVDLGKAAGIEPPVIAVIGDVVDLRQQLQWLDCRPLFGKKVLITRSREQASKLKTLLEEQGAWPVELPTIQAAALEDYARLDAALDRLAQFTWVIFTSTNSVDAVFARLGRGPTRRDARAFGNAKIGAIGPATAAAMERRGLVPDFVPGTSVSEAALEELSRRNWEGATVLLPGADIGRDTLAKGLTRLGASVEHVAAYRTVTAKGVGSLARQTLEQGVDVVTFTSSSTVRNLVAALDGDSGQLASTLIASIGPTTSATARELGLRVDLEAETHTVVGLVKAVTDYFTRKEKQRDG